MTTYVLLSLPILCYGIYLAVTQWPTLSGMERFLFLVDFTFDGFLISMNLLGQRHTPLYDSFLIPTFAFSIYRVWRYYKILNP